MPNCEQYQLQHLRGNTLVTLVKFVFHIDVCNVMSIVMYGLCAVIIVPMPYFLHHCLHCRSCFFCTVGSLLYYSSLRYVV